MPGEVARLRGVPPESAGASPSDAVLADLLVRARGEDAGSASILGSVAVLRNAGLLGDDGSADPDRTAQRLMRIAGVNLSLARLYEGHVNALRLIGEHASDAVRAMAERLVGDGAFFGVWGADGDPPLTCEGGRLRGRKRYASGLGTVTHAVVSLGAWDVIRLGLVNVTASDRQDARSWAMPGMRATRSGTFDFTGIAEPDVAWIGDPGDYTREPTFVGGVWRIAAVQLGAAIGLIDVASRTLKASGRLSAEPQMARMAWLFVRAAAARDLVLRASRVAEGPAGRARPERSVCLSASARLLTEDLGLATIAGVEQSLGLPHFEAGSDSARMARDLSVYMRQAARDALLRRVGEEAFSTDSVWDLLR